MFINKNCKFDDLYLIESSKGHFGMGHAGHLRHLAHNLETHFLKNITSKRKSLKSRLKEKYDPNFQNYIDDKH